jgi:CubicO group peptidase (beta-lactamase class C family)
MERDRPRLITRREVLRTALAASVAGTLPARSFGASEPVQNGYDFEPVRQRIKQAITHEEATGVAVAVAHRGRIIWEEGFGWANRESGVKVTPHTPFSLASITKPFTTTTLMTLVAEGKISLDEPANSYLQKSKLSG